MNSKIFRGGLDPKTVLIINNRNDTVQRVVTHSPFYFIINQTYNLIAVIRKKATTYIKNTHNEMVFHFSASRTFVFFNRLSRLESLDLLPVFVLIDQPP